MTSMKSYAQFGEDVKLHRLLTSGAPGLHADGVYVEVGGNDGISGSNTLLFEELGYRCVVVEPIGYLARRIREHRRGIVVEAAADRTNGRARFLVARGGDTLSTLDNENRIHSRIDEHPHLEKIEVVTKTLDTILEEAGLTAGADRLELVSIDVEGNEPSVLQGFSVTIWKPRVVIIEDNSFGRNRAVPSWFAQHGYVRFKLTGVNHWYCRSDDAQLNRRRYRLAAGIAAAAARIYGAVSGRGRLRADHCH
jgi:FkbM family methyltransferase